jgi:hypothetical protein
MRLRDELESVMVPGPDGTAVPLAYNERLLVDADREPEADSIEARDVQAGILVGALALVLMALGLGAGVRRGSRAAAAGLVVVTSTVHAVLGLLASLVVFMWFFTNHSFWAWNQHLLLFTPVSLLVAAMILVSRGRVPMRRWVERYHMLMAASGFVVSLLILFWYRRAMTPPAELLLTWASAAWLVHLAFGFALSRAPRGAGGEAPIPPARAAQMAA